MLTKILFVDPSIPQNSYSSTQPKKLSTINESYLKYISTESNLKCITNLTVKPHQISAESFVRSKLRAETFDHSDWERLSGMKRHTKKTYGCENATNEVQQKNDQW